MVTDSNQPELRALSADVEAKLRQSVDYHLQHVRDHPELWGKGHRCDLCTDIPTLFATLDAERSVRKQTTEERGDRLEGMVNRLCGRLVDSTMALQSIVNAARLYCLAVSLRADNQASLFDALDREHASAARVLESMRQTSESETDVEPSEVV